MILKSLGPAVARAPVTEVLRAGLGACLGLGLVGLFLLSPLVDLRLGLYLIAPFGATSVLVFAVPSSPLAQPWSVLVGNVVAALVGVAVVLVVPDPALAVALAVGLAISAMMLVRAVHPPAGAVAMTAALNPDAVQALSFWFALAPVGVGSLALIVLAAFWGRITGRRAAHPSPASASAQNPALEAILAQTGQEWNITPEALADLIGAAELQAAVGRMGAPLARDVMTQAPVTVDARTPIPEVADLFARHGFACLPVVTTGDRFVGLIRQIDLIKRARQDALRMERGFGAALSRLVARGQPATAADIMTAAPPRAGPLTPIGLVLPLLAEGRMDAVPVLERGRIIGIISRSDLLTALIPFAAKS